MPNPQQPELRRSGNVPALNPDAQEAELEASREARLREKRLLADHSLNDQAESDLESDDGQRPPDQPDPDAVAEQLGVKDDGSSS